MNKLVVLPIIIGVVGWFAFIFVARFIVSLGAQATQPSLALAFLVAIPIVIVTIIVVSKILGIALHETFMPMVIITIIALTFDGASVAFTGFYGDTIEETRTSSALLLWGAGLNICISFLLSLRTPSSE